MQQELFRHLAFSGSAALAQGRGLLAELHGLQLEAFLAVDAALDPLSGAGSSTLALECADLLSRAAACPEVVDDRAVWMADAAAAAGLGECHDYAGAAMPTIAESLAADEAWGGHLEEARRARQQTAQAAKLLYARLAVAQPDAAPADQNLGLNFQQQQQPQPSPPPQAWPSNGGAAACGSGGGRRQLVVPQLAAAPNKDAPLPSKRTAEGVPKQPSWPQQQPPQQPQPQQPPPPPQQQQQPPSVWPQRGGSGAGPGGFGNAANNSSGGPGLDATAAAAAGGVGGGFRTARVQYAADLRKKGQHEAAASVMHGGGAPGGRHTSGLTRGGRGGRAGIGGGGGGGGGCVGGKGFVPPFVGKALDANGAGGGGNGEEGPLSARTLEMLGVSCIDELPPELAKCDPKLIEQVCNDVVDASGGVSWDDIAGLDTVKGLIREIVVWPMLNPAIFTGPRAPPKGILLFGPPGTGKTLIGKAVASNIKAAFFSISASSLTSKWIGEGEKLVRTLFAVAGALQPSVIFVDEIDSLMSARKADGEHEASRRLKTEMLVQMEGCDPGPGSRRVLLVGATNRPEELDEAARRRMPKQLYIPLPCAAARRAMVLRQLGPGGAVAAALSDADLDKLVERTAGYSGSDMRNLIQEACQGPVREAVKQAGGERVAQLRGEDLRPVRLRDFQIAAKAQRASVTPAEIARYEDYNERHGARYTDGTGGGGGGDGGGGDGGDGLDEDEW